MDFGGIYTQLVTCRQKFTLVENLLRLAPHRQQRPGAGGASGLCHEMTWHGIPCHVIALRHIPLQLRTQQVFYFIPKTLSCLTKPYLTIP